jgi:hypothetical protein
MRKCDHCCDSLAHTEDDFKTAFTIFLLHDVSPQLSFVNYNLLGILNQVLFWLVREPIVLGLPDSQESLVCLSRMT